MKIMSFQGNSRSMYHLLSSIFKYSFDSLSHTMKAKRYWSDDEQKLLRRLYPTSTTALEIAILLRRTEGGVRQMASRLNLKRYKQNPWSTEEASLLKQRFLTGDSKDEIAKDLDRTVSSVQNQIFRMSLKRKSHYWTPEDISYLRSSHGKVPYKEIAKELGRSIRAIEAKIQSISVSGEGDDWRWTINLETVRQLANQGHTPQKIADEVKASTTYIRKYMRRHNIEWTRNDKEISRIVGEQALEQFCLAHNLAFEKVPNPRDPIDYYVEGRPVNVKHGVDSIAITRTNIMNAPDNTEFWVFFGSKSTCYVLKLEEKEN